MVSLNKIVRTEEKSIIFIWLAVCTVLISSVLLPLFALLLRPSCDDYARIVSQTNFLTILRNTFSLCTLSSVFSVLIGFMYAYAVVYSQMPFRRFFTLLPLAHLVFPPSVSSLSFILLFGKNGFVTQKILNLDISPYGMWAVVMSQVMCFFPIAYIVCFQRLKSIDHLLEGSACSMGRSAVGVFLLTVRLSLSAIVQSFLFVFVLVMSDFGNPLILAGRFRVLPLEIYSQLTGWMDIDKSAGLGVFLLIPSLCIFLLQGLVFKKNMKKTSLIGDGNGHDDVFVSVPKVLKYGSIVFCMLISVYIFSQVLSVLFGSFQRIWGVDSSLTLNHIAKIADAKIELKNSFIFAFVSSILSGIFSLSASYVVNRSECRFRRLISSLAQLPSALPGTLFGLAYLIISSTLDFHNSFVMITVAISVGFIPFSYRIFSSRFSEISQRIDEASLSCGYSKFQTFFRVILPLLSPSIAASLIYTFIRALGTISAVIFLVSFDTPLVSLKILSLTEQGFWGDAAALSSALMLVTFLVLFLAYIIVKIGRKCGKIRQNFIFL